MLDLKDVTGISTSSSMRPGTADCGRFSAVEQCLDARPALQRGSRELGRDSNTFNAARLNSLPCYPKKPTAMPTIHQLPQELLSRIVAASSLTCDDDDNEDPITWLNPDMSAYTPPQTIKSISETCHVLRAHALPHLWSKASISISFDRLSDSLRGVKSFTLPSHPIRQHARSLDLRLDSQHVTLSRVLLASLDLRLARAITGMSGLQNACVQMKTAFQFPRTMRATLSRPDLGSLTIAARGDLTIPAVHADKLEKLLVHGDVGSCRLDLSVFSNLRELSLSMEDNSACQSWDELRFPPQIWSTLNSLSLRGFVLDPFGPLGRLNESLRYVGQANALRAVSYHLARDEQDATYAWQTLSQLPLTRLSFTVPVLFDARYARRMIRAFPHLQDLELFAFSRAAAWQWPDPFEAYIRAFTELPGLQTLSLNHNDLTTASLPPSIPGALPVFPSVPVLLSVDIGSSSPPQAGDGASNITDMLQADEVEESAEEPVMTGPLGLSFCPSASADDLEKQSHISLALFAAIPTLQSVSFEPGLTEKVNANPFAYKISYTTYDRSRPCF